jgi:hypothetical protein
MTHYGDLKRLIFAIPSLVPKEVVLAVEELEQRIEELEKLKDEVLEENHALTEKNDDLQERVVNLSADIEKYLDLPIGPDVAGRQILHEAVGRPWP